MKKSSTCWWYLSNVSVWFMASTFLETSGPSVKPWSNCRICATSPFDVAKKPSKFHQTFYFQTVSNMESREHALNGAGQFGERWRRHCVNWGMPLAVAFGNIGCRWNTICSFMWSLLPDTLTFIVCSSALNTTSDLPEVGWILWNAIFDHTQILHIVGSSGWAATSITSAPQACFWSVTVCSRALTSVVSVSAED